MKTAVITFLFLLIQLCASGQKKSVVHYNGSALAGALYGANGMAFEVQAINGIRYKGFYAGAGIGLDKYYTKSIPLFAALRKDIRDQKKTPFVYLNIGSNFPLAKTDGGITAIDYWYSFKAGNGLYFDSGIGYAVPLAGQLRFLLSLGISLKDRVEERKWGGYGLVEPHSETYHYQFRRYSLKAGLTF